MIYFRRYSRFVIKCYSPDVRPAATCFDDFFDILELFANFRRYSRFSDVFLSFCDILNVVTFGRYSSF